MAEASEMTKLLEAPSPHEGQEPVLVDHRQHRMSDHRRNYDDLKRCPRTGTEVVAEKTVHGDLPFDLPP